MTLGEAWDMCLAERRRKGRAPRTIANLEDIRRVYLSDWLTRPLAEVFADRLGVVRLHERLSARGPVQANRVFRALRAVLRRARRLGPTLPRRRRRPSSRTRRDGAATACPRPTSCAPGGPLCRS
jgi:hypothetical protein